MIKKTNKALTLVEIIITMIIIAIIAIATVPLLKKTKLHSKDTAQHYWYCTRDQNNKLISGTNNSETLQMDTANNVCKFKAPAGFEKLNIIVVGGGGGGASAKSGVGEKRIYLTNAPDIEFIPPKTASYEIIAVGSGGGGGGGGSLAGRGGAGGAGTILYAEKVLISGMKYRVVPGLGGRGGKGDSFLDILLVVMSGFGLSNLMPGIGVLGEAIGSDIFSALTLNFGFWGADKWSRTDKWDGGGMGMPSTIQDEAGNIIAGARGGMGGRFRYWGWKCKWYGCYPKKKWSGGDDANNLPTDKHCLQKDTKNNFCINPFNAQDACYMDGGTPKCSGVNDEQAGRYINSLSINFEQVGKGGRGGSNGSGSNGSDGVVQIAAYDLFAGAPGQAGGMTSYTYNRMTPGWIDVYPGNGGTGSTLYNTDGIGGESSRFGTRLFANGGSGGEKEYSDQITEGQNGEKHVSGFNGEKSPVSMSLLKEVMGDVPFKEIYGGGLTPDNPQSLDAKGHASDYRGLPGTGGGSGASKSMPNSTYEWGNGGSGSPGIVIITW